MRFARTRRTRYDFFVDRELCDDEVETRFFELVATLPLLAEGLAPTFDAVVRPDLALCFP